ncbi:MAG: hypothetical protein KKB31_06525 [Nanoarchaeota archaeon]|nr:hypothetical protein [Nanoarchaeota archaeon]
MANGENGLEKSINGFVGSKSKLGRGAWFIALSYLAGASSKKNQDWVMERIGMPGKAYLLTLVNAGVVGPAFAGGYYFAGQVSGWADNVPEWLDKPVEAIASAYSVYVFGVCAFRATYASIKKKAIFSPTPWGVITTGGWGVVRKIFGVVGKRKV